MDLFKKKRAAIRFAVPVKEGQTVDLMFTINIYKVAKKCGIIINEVPSTVYDTLTFYADIMYCAALNFWELSEGKGNAPVTRLDFHSFYVDNPQEFKKAVQLTIDAAQQMMADVQGLAKTFEKWGK